MWWKGYSNEKSKDYLNKGQNLCEGPEVRGEITIASHNPFNNASTNGEKPGRGMHLPGIDSDSRKHNHNWLKAVMNIENKQTQIIMREKNKKVREKLWEQIKNILLSNNKITNKNTLYLPKNCQLYKFTCKLCNKKFKQNFSLKNI